MRIQSIEIHDTLGTKHAKFSPGTVTRVKGHNGSGKSSILKALIYIFEGGLSPEIIRKGAQKSVIQVRLDNGVTITKTTASIKPRKAKTSDPDPSVKYRADLEILDADETPIPAPQTFVSNLSRALAVDPSTLLRIDVSTVPGRKQLADTLMKLVPISFSPEEIGKAVAYKGTLHAERPDTVALRQSPENPITLDEHKKLVAEITEQRRRHGQTRDDADGAINRLQKALPDGAQDSSAIAAELESAEEYRRTVEKAIGDRKLEIEQQKAAIVLEAREALAAQEKAVNRDIEERIRLLEAERTERLNVSRAEYGRHVAGIDDVSREAYAQLDAEASPKLQEAAADVARIKELVNQFHRAATLREEIDTQLIALRAAAWKYDRLSDVLRNMDALRLEKLNSLPVRGLVVEDGEALIDGIPWANVNLARRVEAVLEICTQQTGKLPFIILDDSEHLDAETRALVEGGLAQAGYQLLEAMVTDGPLTIEPIEVPVHA